MGCVGKGFLSLKMAASTAHRLLYEIIMHLYVMLYRLHYMCTYTLEITKITNRFEAEIKFYE
jgi:hypothetical protein